MIGDAQWAEAASRILGILVLVLFPVVVLIQWSIVYKLKRRHNAWWKRIGSPSLTSWSSPKPRFGFLRFLWNRDYLELPDSNLRKKCGLFRLLLFTYFFLIVAGSATAFYAVRSRQSTQVERSDPAASRRDVVLPIERNHAAVSAREPTGGGGTRNADRHHSASGRAPQPMADGVVRRVLAQVEVSFSNSGLNSNRYLRIGWGRHGGKNVFRIAGKLLRDLKIDIFRDGPL